ncbi:MAG: hypothetical protein ACK5GU_05525 [Chloroflexota bacterium]
MLFRNTNSGLDLEVQAVILRLSRACWALLEFTYLKRKFVYDCVKSMLALYI